MKTFIKNIKLLFTKNLSKEKTYTFESSKQDISGILTRTLDRNKGLGDRL